MCEIGGYLELENYSMPMLHEDAIALNTGRNCLAYLIETNNIESIYLPYFICSAIIDICNKYKVRISFYHINDIDNNLNIDIEDRAYLYVINYYGQLTNNKIIELKKRYNNLIIDNAHAYFQRPVQNVDTIYTCRKFFGVTDGAFLYTDKKLQRILERDFSHKRAQFLLGRYEKSANEFYQDFLNNEEVLSHEKLKVMSKLTYNLLHGIDYVNVRNKRTQNYNFLYNNLEKINKLKLKRIEGAFSYPLHIENSKELRETLISNKIYIPILWPNVLNENLEGTLEYDMAENILPLPCDQRYDKHDIEYIMKVIKKEVCL